MYNQMHGNNSHVYINQQGFMTGPNIPKPAYDINASCMLQYPSELHSSAPIACLDQMAYIDSGHLNPSYDNGVLALSFLPSNQRVLNENVGATKILVNPHFKKNVHINPNFGKQAGFTQAMNVHIKPPIKVTEAKNEGPIRQPTKNIHLNPAKHIAASGRLLDSITGRCASNIHVNPHILKSDLRTTTSGSETVVSSHMLSSENSEAKLSHLQDSNTSEPVYKSKNKLIRVPVNIANNNIAPAVSNVNPRRDSVNSKFKIQRGNIQKRRNSVITRYKLVKSGIGKPTHLVPTKLKQVKKNMSPMKRLNLVQTRYKIVKSKSPKKGAASTSDDTKDKNQPGTYPPNELIPLANQYQLDNRNKKQIEKRTKYVYVDKFYNITHLAKNMLIKKGQGLNSSKPGYVHINGILYKKSPNSIKRANLDRSSSSYLADNHMQPGNRNTPLPPSTLKKFTFKSHTSKQNCHTKSPRLSKMKKLVKISPSKLRKSNVPCSVYRKFGKCSGKDNGKCIKIHNPKQIVLCTKFLQGACLKKNCLLSHEISPEKMPTCKYFLDGSCSRDDCQYLHVKISPKADICIDFLQGFCNKAIECDKRHQYLCPEFEKSGKCPRKRCSFPHGERVRKINNIRKNARKCSDQMPVNTIHSSCNKNVNQKSAGSRYYENSRYSDKLPQTPSQTLHNINDNLGCESEIGLKNRPKLGNLPTYIPLIENKS